VVLVETLSVNQELALLVLQDNPLGALGAHKLLRAVHAGAAPARVCHKIAVLLCHSDGWSVF
jgi:hypothetical protein